MEEFNGKQEMVDPLAIVVDHRYQRPEKPALIAAISTDPRWELFGAVILFQRGSTYYAADGQQRLAGLKRSVNPPRKVPAVVFAAESLEDEAAVFVHINEFRKALTSQEKHKGKIVAKDPAALVIERAVEKVGVTIGNQSSDMKQHTITAVSTLYDVYNLLGEEGLVQTLTVCRDAWPNESRQYATQILRVVANIILEQNGKYERSALTNSLSKAAPGQLFRKAEEFKFDMGGSAGVNMRRAVKALCKV